jgi:hypothetical protein
MTAPTQPPPTNRGRKSKRQSDLLQNGWYLASRLLGAAVIIGIIALLSHFLMISLWKDPQGSPAFLRGGKTATHNTPTATETTGTDQTILNNHIQAGKVQETGGNPPVPKAIPLPNPQPEPITHNSQTANGISHIELKRDLIQTTLRRYFSARSLSQMLPLVRDPERVRPKMESFYSRTPMASAAFKDLGWIKSIAEPGQRLGYVQALLDAAPPMTLVIEETRGGDIVIDWESAVRYSESTWQAFLQQRPKTPTLFRIIASRPEPSSTPQKATPLLEALTLRHPSEDGSLLAEFDPADPKLAPLLEQMEAGQWQQVPLTLHLFFPGRSPAGTPARIASVEGKGWLILNQPRS